MGEQQGMELGEGGIGRNGGLGWKVGIGRNGGLGWKVGIGRNGGVGKNERVEKRRGWINGGIGKK